MVDLNHAWYETLRMVERQVPANAFQTWLSNTRPLAQHEDTVFIGVASQFARIYIQQHFSSLLQDTLRGIWQKEVHLQFIIPPEEAMLGDEAAAAAENPVSASQHLFPSGIWSKKKFPLSEQPRQEPEPEISAYQPLNPRYTFDTFVIGSSNRLAHAASLAVSEAPAKAYNPLFIYGGVGLGKTHLMHAIAHNVLRRSPKSRVMYVSSETFANEMINAIRDRRTADFRHRYRNIDVLLVDDIQFLAGKESTQEEFFHTFNALHEANHQIVISSDRPPKEIPTLEDRLRSRFEWGLISDIQPPDLETRIAILRKKAQLEGFEFPDEVMEFIAENINTNIRELEGALIRIVAYASLHHLPIELPVAREALKNILQTSQPRKITIQSIQEEVARHYQLEVRDLKIKKRTRAVAYPRQIAMYLCRELTDNSLPKIGEEFGGRDHTTVIHACEKIQKELKVDSQLAADIESIKKRLL